MANVYTNYKAVLSSTNLTTLYTVPAQTTAIIKSVRVANVDTSNNCEVSLYLVDTGDTLKANGLVPLNTICEISSRLIVNKATMKTKNSRVKDLIQMLRDEKLTSDKDG